MRGPRLRVVLDTNVLLSALLFPGGPPDQVFGHVRRQALDLYLSPFILDEFRRVLLIKFQHSEREAKARVAYLLQFAHMVEPQERLSVITAKEDDNRILECAVAAQADYLVTGDKAHLLPLKRFRGIEIVSPGEFLRLFERSRCSGP